MPSPSAVDVGPINRKRELVDQTIDDAVVGSGGGALSNIRHHCFSPTSIA